MPSGELNVTEDASAGAWIPSRLQGEFGAVTLAVPSGYLAYARICHPVSDARGRATSWRDVARATGRTAHPLMQWHALVGSSDPLNFTGSLWSGEDPERGDLQAPALEALCAILREHSEDAEHCFFALWVGWGWVHRGVQVVSSTARDDSNSSTTVHRAAAFSADELRRARLVTPHAEREYVLLAGPLSAASQLGDRGASGGFWAQSPNLFWPADRAWCVASEIDFDSTLVGGSSELIQSLIDSPDLDAWPVRPDDSLAADGDRINVVPG